MMPALPRWRGRAPGEGGDRRARIEALAAPLVERARGAFARFGPTERAPLALYALYTFALFVLFLAATFPHELVVRRMLARTADAPVVVAVSGVRLGWLPLAYRFDELRLQRRGDESGTPLLTATAVRVAPSLLGLLRGRLYPVGLRADLYGGTVRATVDLGPDAFDVDGTLADVDAGRYAGLRLWMDGTLAGRVGGTVVLRGDPRKPTSTNGQVALTIAGLAVEGGKIQGITVPDLHFPEVRLAGTVKGGRLDLGDLRARGQEINLAGGGNLLLQHPLAATLLNLDVTLSPAATVPDNLRLAVNLIPGEPDGAGGRRVRIFGSIGQPRIGR
jgi:type II secretion system protein N